MRIKRGYVIGWKLFRLRKDGTLGPLFVDCKMRVPENKWLKAKRNLHHSHLKFRPGWHCAATKNAPHLTTKGRVWRQVIINDYEPHPKPACQGGLWYVARWIHVLPTNANNS